MTVLGQSPYASCFAMALLLALGLVAALRWLAPRVGMLDIPAGRKQHGHPMPLLGGLGIFIAAAACLILHGGTDRQTIALVVGAAVVLALGLWDDWRGLRARFRLVVQILSAGGAVTMGAHFEWLPWTAANQVVSVIWLVGMVNALNCLDCADGVAAGAAAVASAAFCAVAIASGHSSMGMLAAGVLGGCIGFLAFNFPPASIFLGDAGSASLGFLLGGLAIASSAGMPSFHQAWVAALPLAVPICDIALVHLRRYQMGTRNLRDLLESTGRDHLPHRLEQLGLPPRQIAVTAYLMAGLLALPATMVAVDRSTGLTLVAEIAALTLIAGERSFARLVSLPSRIRQAGAAPAVRATDAAARPQSSAPTALQRVTH